MRYFLLIFGLTILGVMLIAGKRGDISRRPPLEVFPDMDRMPKLRPQTRADFFTDGMSSRLPVAGTVARGSAWQDAPVNTGKQPGTTNWVEVIPVAVNEQLMKRGQERYTVYCLVCHGAAGDGKGITGKYGMVAMANFHDPRLVKMADGEIFNAITFGKNLMGPYGGQIPIEDRWAIIAYVRALQRSRLATLDDVPADHRDALRRAMPPPAPATNAPAARPQ
ncbi:MAG: cytochrome c [Verrucomicrobia subdivision 3 bacterium]|nr:cytochrome c [Limisphaerales bacterium]